MQKTKRSKKNIDDHDRAYPALKQVNIIPRETKRKKHLRFALNEMAVNVNIGWEVTRYSRKSTYRSRLKVTPHPT